MKINVHTIIIRPINDVFNYLADVRNDVHWRDEVTQHELISEGPRGVGSEGRIRVNQFGRETESTWKCTRSDPPEHIEWELTSGPLLGNAGYKLKAIDGGTDFTYYGTAKLAGIMRLFSPIIQFLSNKLFQKDVENLKRILESNTP